MKAKETGPDKLGIKMKASATFMYSFGSLWLRIITLKKIYTAAAAVFFFFFSLKGWVKAKAARTRDEK